MTTQLKESVEAIKQDVDAKASPTPCACQTAAASRVL